MVDGMGSHYGPSARFDPEIAGKVDKELSTPEVNPLVAKLDALPRRRPLSLPEIVDPETFPGSPFHEGVFRPQRFSSWLAQTVQLGLNLVRDALALVTMTLACALSLSSGEFLG